MCIIGMKKDMPKSERFGKYIMISKKFIALTVLPILMFSMTSCALVARDVFNGPDKLAATRKEKHVTPGECRYILIVAAIKDVHQRVSIENVFTDRLSQQGFPAVVGSLKLEDIMSFKDQAILKDLIQSEKIDHLLTIEVKDVGGDVRPDWRRNWSTAILEEDMTRLIVDEGSTKNVRFEITLWNAKTLKREWTGSTHALDRFDILRDLPEAADSTALSLIKEKILRPGKS